MQTEIIQYLENKYGQEFEVVKDARWDVTGGYFILTARPKENRRVTFLGYKNPSGEFWDYYPDELWTVQLNDEIKPLMDQLYPPRNRWEFELIVFRNDVLKKQLDEIDPKNIPDYSEVRKQHPDLTHLDLEMKLAKDVSESNQDEELEKVYRLIQFFREKGIQDYRIDIDYFEERLLKEKGRDKKEDEGLGDYVTHEIYVTDKDAETIHSPKDLEKYLEKDPKVY